MPEPEARTPVPERRSSPAERLQDRLAGLFGIAGADRTKTVGRMLGRGQRVPAGYWLQLVLAMAIATLGLLLGSSAVVIGAMLVSPLMGPIIELGMGLAVGSPLLVVRTAIRVSLSVVLVVLSAAALTVAVPIHQVTSEIAARTSPNLLDLAIASFCALAGVYAAIRSDMDTASTAAGTAIGIALVPPLCVVGIGLGTTAPPIAGGAALLFTANLCAILFVSVVAFVTLGYGRVDVASLERAQRDANEPGFVRTAARRLSVFFSSKLGPALRVAMPLTFVAAVFVPLRSALREVTWEVQTRKAMREALSDIRSDTIEVSVRVEQHRVYIRVIAIEDGGRAERLRARLIERVRAASGVTPDVEVVAVPDAESLARAQAALRNRAPSVAPSSVPPTEAAFERARRDVEDALAVWPAEHAGALAGWSLTMTRAGVLRVEVLHVGNELGRPATEMLASDLGTRLATKVVVDDVALAAEPVRGVTARGPAHRAASFLARFPETAGVHACIDVPRDEAGELDAHGDPRVVVRIGSEWKLAWSATGCTKEPAAGALDAGADAAANDGGDAMR